MLWIPIKRKFGVLRVSNPFLFERQKEKGKENPREKTNTKLKLLFCVKDFCWFCFGREKENNIIAVEISYQKILSHFFCFSFFQKYQNSWLIYGAFCWSSGGSIVFHIFRELIISLFYLIVHYSYPFPLYIFLPIVLIYTKNVNSLKEGKEKKRLNILINLKVTTY